MFDAILAPFIGSKTTPATSSHHTNDASSPSRSVRASHSPTESRRKHPTVDLTSPARANKRPAPAESNATGEPARKPKRVKISPEEARLCPNYNIPADATPLPAPWTCNPALKTMKPGSKYQFTPTDTFAGVMNPRHGHGRPKMYGSKHQSRFDSGLEFLEDQPIKLPDTPRRHAASASDNPYSAKRRKTEHPITSFTHEVIDLEGDEVVEAPFVSQPRRLSQSQHPAITQSQRSFESGPTVAGAGSAGRRSRSELEETSMFFDPHRKKSRNPVPPQTPSGASFGRVDNGSAISSPITVDDDEAPATRSKSPGQLKYGQFQQGVVRSGRHSPEAKITQAYPKHVAKNVPKFNHSTSPPRGEPRGERPATHRTSQNLRDRFRRADDISDDELVVEAPRAVKRSKSPSKHRASAKVASKGKENPPAFQWCLEFARTHGYEGRGPDLFLQGRSGDPTFDLIELGGNGKLECKSTVSMYKVVDARADDTSRIRLKGSRPANGVQYLFDLEFLDSKDFRLFRDEHVGKAIRKVTEKTEEHMQKLFSKPFDAIHKPVSPPPTNPALNQGEARVQNAAIEARRPASRLKSLDQQAQNDTGGEIPAKSHSTLDTELKQTQNGSLRASARPTRTTRASRPVYVGAEKEKDPEKYSVVHGLGTPWARQLNYGTGRRRAVVDFADLERLDDGEFLNDQLIDFYMLYLFNQTALPPNKVYIFNTHFFSTLTRKVPGQKTSINYSAVARWTSKEDLFGYDYIVVPINQDVHWYLAIICNVPNIPRKPALEDLDDTSTTNPEASVNRTDEKSKERNEAQRAETDEKSAERGGLILPPALVDPTADTSALELDDDVNFFEEEESKLNLVDPDAAISDPNRAMAATDDKRVRESSVEETAHMAKLSIADRTPKGILPDASSSPASSKKSKRKSGPPPKKWNTHEPTIIILDSLGGGARSQAVRALKDYIREEGREKRGMEANITQNAYYAKNGQIPMQDNFSDCGVYLLGYAQKFFQNPDAFKDRLLTGDMRMETDWPDMPMSQMRSTMRDILFKLHDQDEAERKQARAEKKAKKSASASAPWSTVPPAKDHTGKTGLVTTKKEALANSSVTAPEPPADPEPAVSTAISTKPGPPAEPSAGAPKGRLGSPFSPQPPTKQDPRSQSPVKSAPGKAQDSPAASIPRRRTSPVVLIPKKSPQTPLSSKQPRALFAVNSNATRHVEIEVHSSKKRKLEASEEYSAAIPKAHGTPRPQPVANGDAVPFDEGVEVHSPKKPKLEAGGVSKAATDNAKKAFRQQPVANKKNEVIEQNGVYSPKKRTKDADNMSTSAFTKAGRAESPRSFRTAPTDASVKLKKPTKGALGAAILAQDAHGSSQDPITIDDSQDAIITSPPKAMKSNPGRSASQDSIIVTSPKRSKAQPSPGVQRHRRQTSVEEIHRPTLNSREGVSHSPQDMSFVGDELLSYLGNSPEVKHQMRRHSGSPSANQSGTAAQEPTEADDEETSWEGFLDDALETEGSSQAAERDESVTAYDDTTVPETPPARRSSPPMHQ